MQKSLDNTAGFPLKSTEQLQEVMHDLLERALKKGATAAEVCIDQDRGFSIDVRMKEVETVSFCDDQALAITLYIDQKKGSASTTELRSHGLDQLVDAAFHIAQVSASDPCFGLAEKNLLSKQHPDLDLFHPWNIDTVKAISLAKECEDIAFKQDAMIVNSDGINVSSYVGCVGYANTNGAEGIIYNSRHNMSCSLIAKQADKLQRDYDYTTARHPDHLISTALLAQNTASRVIKRLGARKIKTQRAPVLFDSRIASHLIGLFLQGISGGALYRKQSFLVDSLGKSIFPKEIHIQEFPYISGALGSSPFDGEGVTTRENTFVDNGIVQQYVLSSYTARRLGLQTSANAGGVHNLTVKPTSPDLASLIKRMNTGLLVTELMGDGVNLQNGDYSKGAFGYWIENGEIQYPVEEITIAGNLKDIYKQILGVGADWDRNHATRCGSILIESMMIAGQ
jgi:PmbA protein